MLSKSKVILTQNSLGFHLNKLLWSFPRLYFGLNYIQIEINLRSSIQSFSVTRSSNIILFLNNIIISLRVSNKIELKKNNAFQKLITNHLFYEVDYLKTAIKINFNHYSSSCNWIA
ncbi:unnamed protein product [Paramecium octaurelia]|uniref:Uncharacterized protein n=1 Tax=Paramecium octaurelia TaxID=43137 RepID=A0A8S1Y6T9_PAROT|nr:unnamed protein product [Paramecium octaurelia]